MKLLELILKKFKKEKKLDAPVAIKRPRTRLCRPLIHSYRGSKSKF